MCCCVVCQTEPLSLLVHLGMTGSLIVRGVDSFKFVSHQHGKDDAWPPRFTKVRRCVIDTLALSCCTAVNPFC
jgi:hypothetical protein